MSKALSSLPTACLGALFCFGPAGASPAVAAFMFADVLSQMHHRASMFDWDSIKMQKNPFAQHNIQDIRPAEFAGAVKPANADLLAQRLQFALDVTQHLAGSGKLYGTACSANGATEPSVRLPRLRHCAEWDVTGAASVQGLVALGAAQEQAARSSAASDDATHEPQFAQAVECAILERAAVVLTGALGGVRQSEPPDTHKHHGADSAASVLAVAPMTSDLDTLAQQAARRGQAESKLGRAAAESAALVDLSPVHIPWQPMQEALASDVCKLAAHAQLGGASSERMNAAYSSKRQARAAAAWLLAARGDATLAALTVRHCGPAYGLWHHRGVLWLSAALVLDDCAMQDADSSADSAVHSAAQPEVRVFANVPYHARERPAHADLHAVQQLQALCLSARSTEPARVAALRAAQHCFESGLVAADVSERAVRAQCVTDLAPQCWLQKCILHHSNTCYHLVEARGF